MNNIDPIDGSGYMITDLPNLIELGLLLLAVGALAGLLAGLLGVGGGIVLVPALSFTFTALGYASSGLMQICIATSLASIVFTSMRSVAAHHKKGAVDWGILKSWAPGIVVGAIVGVLTAASLSSTVLQGIFGGLALIVGAYLLFGRIEWRLKDDMPVGLMRTADSTLIGFMSVLMGIGGGSFGVPFMTLHGVAIHRAVATAAGFGLLIALPSMIGFLFVPVEIHPPFTIGAVNLPALLIIISMTLLTAPLGARLAHVTDAKRLKRIFGAFLILVAANMIRKSIGW